MQAILRCIWMLVTYIHIFYDLGPYVVEDENIKFPSDLLWCLNFNFLRECRESLHKYLLAYWRGIRICTLIKHGKKINNELNSRNIFQ